MHRYALWLALAGCGGDFGVGSGTTQVQGNGNPHMTLSAESLGWTDLEVKKAESQVLVITSDGDTDLVIDPVTIEDDATGSFYLEEVDEPLTIAPGADHELLVVCDLQVDEAVTATLRLASNSGDVPTVDVPLSGSPVGAAPGDSGDSGQ